MVIVMSERRAWISAVDYDNAIQVAVVHEVDGKTYVEQYDPSLRTWRRETVERGAASPEPTLQFDMETATMIYQAMHKFFEKRGVRPTTQSYIEGKLEATESHLRDIRYLMKLPKLDGGVI